MNMFKGVKARSVSEYIENLPSERKVLIVFLHKFVQKVAPNLKPHFAYNMLGYGSFPYKNYKKEMISWPVVAIANQKNYVSIYVCSVDAGEYVAEKYKDKLGKVSVGKSCIRFNKLEDVNLPFLAEVIKKAEEKPGLES